MVVFLELVKSLSWPAVIAGLGVLFRAEIRQSLARMSSLRFRNFEVSFGEALKAAGDLAAAAGPAVLKEINRMPVLAAELARLRRLAGVSPRAAILEAWHEVESVGAEAARVEGLTEATLQGMVDRGVLPGPARALAERLRGLRDRVAAEGIAIDGHLSSEQARKFAELAQALIGQLPAVNVNVNVKAGAGAAH